MFQPGDNLGMFLWIINNFFVCLVFNILILDINYFPPDRCNATIQNLLIMKMITLSVWLRLPLCFRLALPLLTLELTRSYEGQGQGRVACKCKVSGLRRLGKYRSHTWLGVWSCYYRNVDMFLAHMFDLFLALFFVQFLLHSLMRMLTSLLIPGSTLLLRHISLGGLTLLVYLGCALLVNLLVELGHGDVGADRVNDRGAVLSDLSLITRGLTTLLKQTKGCSVIKLQLSSIPTTINDTVFGVSITKF